MANGCQVRCSIAAVVLRSGVGIECADKRAPDHSRLSSTYRASGMEACRSRTRERDLGAGRYGFLLLSAFPRYVSPAAEPAKTSAAALAMITKKNLPMRAIFFRDHEISRPGPAAAGTPAGAVRAAGRDRVRGRGRRCLAAG